MLNSWLIVVFEVFICIIGLFSFLVFSFQTFGELAHNALASLLAFSRDASIANFLMLLLGIGANRDTVHASI